MHTDIHATAEAELREAVEGRFRDPSFRMPVLPGLALQLVTLARQPNVTFKQLSELIRVEPTLAAEVLRIAQSPLYRRGAVARSIEHAASLLGTQTLIDLFLEASVASRVFRVPAYETPMQQLRKHSVTVAHVTRAVCRAAQFSEDVAFTCGLLHDVGMAVGMIAANDLLLRPKFEQLEPVLFGMHTALGERVATLWRLPEDIRSAVAQHHDPVSPMSAAVCLAEAITDGCPRGWDPSPREQSQAERALMILDLPASAITELRAEARRVA